jgi:glycosyltransferase involved in cell wall biosynthesis
VNAQNRSAGLPLGGMCVAIVNWRDPWHPEAGGAEVHAWQTAQGLLRRGAQVTFLTARGAGQSGRQSIDGIDIIRRGSRFTVYPRVLAWLLARRSKFDAVIDCQNGIPFFTPWVMPRRVPVVCVMHHVHDAQFGVHFPPVVAAVGRFLEGPVARLAYRRQPCVTASESTVRALAERLDWIGPVHVIPYGMSPEAFEVPDLELLESGGAKPADITWVGRMVAHKRVERVLDVAERLAPSGITIDVIGRGPAQAAMDDAIAGRGLAGTVRMRGFLPDEMKRAIVATSLLHLNTSHGEGWGLCVLEAAALGVPTVAYDVDGLRDAVRHGETGWLVRSGERIEDVTERAMQELAEPMRRAEISAACRAWAAQFDWDRSAGQMSELLLAKVRQRAPNDRGAPPAALLPPPDRQMSEQARSEP